MRSVSINNILYFSVLACLCLVAESATAQAVDAAGGDIFASVNAKALDLFKNIRNILMVVGAIGVLCLAAGAFFGKFKWHWAISLLGGLTLIAFVGQVLTYFGLTAPAQ
ncbi:MAG TPA: hypothetical protein HPP80_08445 [Rhodospirillaceae bacterium]|nr:hypothetical protein [Rhodospirillaceae bacterium]